MKADTSLQLDHGPMGIVISHGPSVEHAPTFFAYVWGPDPEDVPEAGALQAA